MHATDIVGYAYDADIWCEDCVPEDNSGCECGATDHNPQCGPIFASEEFDGEPQYCGGCGCCVVGGVVRKCIIDGASGIYVPQRFAERCDAAAWKLAGMAEDIDILLSGPEHEHYWDAWDDVLDAAEHTDSDGHVWGLEQDGDLFAYRVVEPD